MTPAHATRASFRIRHVLLAGIVLAAATTPGAAQSIDPGASENRQVGPLGLTPTVIWQTEYDDNIFHTAARPISDIVSTIGGRTELRGQLRRIGLNGSGSADWVHYTRVGSERGANVGSAIRMDLLFNRVVPYLSGSYSNSRQRTNLEIDTRPRMQQSTVGAGTVLRLGSKTGLDFSAKRAMVAYEQGAMDQGVPVADALNRTSEHASASLKQHVTPLTHLAIAAELSRETFDVSSQRDADSVRLSASYESEGRLNGRVSGGIRILKPHDFSLPESRGYFVAVGTSLTLLDRLQIGLVADRDIAPSIKSAIAYYEYYSFGGSLSYAMRRSLRLTALAGRRVANYEDGISAAPPPPGQGGVDVQTSYGSGVNYRLGDSMAIDVSGTYTERSSPVRSRRFDGMSIKAGVSHVF